MIEVTAIVAVAPILAVPLWLGRTRFPTGLDVGNWLGFGRSWIGDGHKADVATYPPAIPLALRGMSNLFGPLTSAQLLGIGSLAAVYLAVSLSLRRCGLSPWFAIVGGLVPVGSGPFLETYAFGGYPQNYSISLLVGALVFAGLYWKEGRAVHQIAAACLVAGVALTHHAYFAVALASLATMQVVNLTAAPNRRTRWERGAGLGAVAMVGIAAFLPTYLQMRRLGYEAPINPASLAPGASVEYAFRGAAWLWVAAFAATGAFVGLTCARRRSLIWQFVVSAGVAPACALFLTGEPRLIPLLVISATAGSAWMLDVVRRCHLPALSRLSLVVPALALPFFFQQASRMHDDYSAYYRVLDPELRDTISWVATNPVNGSVGVVAIRDGWPVGWWYSGLTDAKIATQSDSKWIAFPGEMSQSKRIDLLLGSAMSAQAASSLARSWNMELLAFRRAEWQGWRTWLDDVNSPIAVVYQNSEYEVLRLYK